jgi:hypothetical protein
MMVFGLKVSETPPFVGKKFSSLTAWNTIWIVRSFRSRWNGRLCRVTRHRSFTTLIRRSISGTCSLLLAKFTMGPPGMDSIKWCKFPVRMSHCDAKTTVEVILVYLLECFKNLGDGPVCEMIDGGETNLSTQHRKKRNFVHKEYIKCQYNLLV